MLPIAVVLNLISLLCFQSLALSSMLPLEIPRNIKFMEGQVVKQPEEAVRIWEEAIAAKGGRERLHAVRNVVMSTRGEYLTRSLKKNQVRGETLFVFPNKYWDWDDYRPDVFGLRISMYNYDTNVKYVISEGEPNHPPEPITETQKNMALRNVQLSFLLETEWLKPALVKASTGTIGLRPMDIVQTTVGGERVDFAFDRKTHLPVRVSYYDVVRGKTYVNVQSFSDYTEVSGIKVPQTIIYDNGSKYKASFQFNVEYNEDIFVKPPSISAGPEAWKKVSSRKYSGRTPGGCRSGWSDSRYPGQGGNRHDEEIDTFEGVSKLSISFVLQAMGIEDTNCNRWFPDFGGRVWSACKIRAADRRTLCNNGVPEAEQPPEYNPWVDAPY